MSSLLQKRVYWKSMELFVFFTANFTLWSYYICRKLMCRPKSSRAATVFCKFYSIGCNTSGHVFYIKKNLFVSVACVVIIELLRTCLNSRSKLTKIKDYCHNLDLRQTKNLLCLRLLSPFFVNRKFKDCISRWIKSRWAITEMQLV